MTAWNRTLPVPPPKPAEERASGSASASSAPSPSAQGPDSAVPTASVPPVGLQPAAPWPPPSSPAPQPPPPQPPLASSYGPPPARGSAPSLMSSYGPPPVSAMALSAPSTLAPLAHAARPAAPPAPSPPSAPPTQEPAAPRRAGTMLMPAAQPPPAWPAPPVAPVPPTAGPAPSPWPSAPPAAAAPPAALPPLPPAQASMPAWSGPSPSIAVLDSGSLAPSGSGGLDPSAAPSSWGGVPAQVLAPQRPAQNYPPLPRPYHPTQTSLVAPPPSTQAPPVAVPPPPPTQDPAALYGPTPAPPPSLPPSSGVQPSQAPRLSRRTVAVLGQTATVDAPEATPEHEMLPSPVGLPAPRPLPLNAPAWARDARLLAGYLEEAISRGEASPYTQAAVRRALLAFRLSGHPPAQIARVCHLVDRACAALRSTARADLNNVLGDCAMIVHRGLPGELRTRRSLDEVTAVTAALLNEPDPRRARALAVARLFGWPPLPDDWLLEAIDTALASAP